MLTDDEKQIANGNGKSGRRSSKSPDPEPTNSSNSSDSPEPPVDESLALAAASSAVAGTLAQAVKDVAQLTADLNSQRDRITDTGASAIATILDRNSIQCETLYKALTQVGGKAPRPFAVAVVDLSPLQVSSPSLPQSYGSLLSLLSSGSTESNLPAMENGTTSSGNSETAVGTA